MYLHPYSSETSSPRQFFTLSHKTSRLKHKTLVVLHKSVLFSKKHLFVFLHGNFSCDRQVSENSFCRQSE